MKKIIIQAGHLNIKNNSIKTLRNATGAPREVEFTEDIATKVVNILKNKGLEAHLVDANANDNNFVTSQDWDLFLSIHYDADIYNDSGGFVAIPDKSVDFSYDKSKTIAEKIRQVYFKETKIKNINRENANTKFYYMWQYLTANTPCVLIECGVGMRKPNDFNILHGNRDLVASAISKGILYAFDIEDEDEANCEEIEKEKDKYKKEARELRKKVKEMENEIEDLKEALNNVTNDFNSCLNRLAKMETEKTSNLSYIEELKTKIVGVDLKLQNTTAELLEAKETIKKLKTGDKNYTISEILSIFVEWLKNAKNK